VNWLRDSMPYIQLAAHQYVRGARAHVYLCLDKIHLLLISGPNTLGGSQADKEMGAWMEPVATQERDVQVGLDAIRLRGHSFVS
jgi:hypothetical protein